MRKQRETRQGRRVRLAERAPSGGRTRGEATAVARRMAVDLVVHHEGLLDPAAAPMMRAANRHHCVGTARVLAIVGVMAVTGLRLWRQREAYFRTEHAGDLFQTLVSARIDQVPGIVRDMDGDRENLNPLLRAAVDDRNSSANLRLHARLALLPSIARVRLLPCSTRCSGRHRRVPCHPRRPPARSGGPHQAAH